MKFFFKFFNFEIMGALRIIKRRTYEIEGFTSRCKDGKHVIMLDYDGMQELWLKDEIAYLQQKYKVGDFLIFRSSESSFHAVCLDKVTLDELEQICYNSSADPRHHKVPLKCGYKLITLRYSEKDKQKPKYIYTLFSNNNETRKKSLPHKKLLGILYPEIPKKVFKGHYDTQTSIVMAKYLIHNNG